VVSGTGGIGLRVRAAPSTEAAVLGTLPDGSRVAGAEHAWRKIQGNGLDGWAANTFLVPVDGPGPIPPPTHPPTDLQDGIDVSNYQPADLSGLIAQYDPTHVVVRASTESSRHRTIARQQIRSALDAGCTVSAYIWAYFDLPPAEHAADAISVMDGLPVERYWVDCEDVCPPGKLEDWLSRAVALIEARGKQSGVYTSRGWWQAHGDSHGFTRLPLWTAQWDEVPTLESVVLYGGWRSAAGKQYSTTGETLDRNVFDGAVC
jgi:GH25 family lysozyme M1 (1,4-beta-N-acetylmuramidase)